MRRSTPSIFSIASKPLPVSVALRTGAVSRPCSMRHASVTWKEKFPSAGFTERRIDSSLTGMTPSDL